MQRTVRVPDNTLIRYRSHGLGEAKFVTVFSDIWQITSQMPMRNTDGMRAPQNPARPTTTAAAATRIAAAPVLARRRAAGRTRWRPPHAAIPSGAPSARAT